MYLLQNLTHNKDILFYILWQLKERDYHTLTTFCGVGEMDNIAEVTFYMVGNTDNVLAWQLQACQASHTSNTSPPPHLNQNKMCVHSHRHTIAHVLLNAALAFILSLNY